MGQCSQAGPDLVDPGLKLWSPDRCANMVLGPVMRPDEHPPIGENYEPQEAGFFDVRSAHLVRAKAVQDPDNEEEVCRVHYAKMTVGQDGFAYPVFCSKPTGSDLDKTTGRGMAFVQRGPQGGQSGNLIEPGFSGFLAAYETPIVTEAHLSSGAAHCGIFS